MSEPTLVSGWLEPNVNARQASVRIRVPPGTSIARFAKNPLVLYGHDNERIVGAAAGLSMDGDDLAATVDFAGVNVSESAEQAWRSVTATLTRLAEVVIQDGEVLEMSLVPIARGAWPADDDAPLGAERANRAECTPSAPCGGSGCALCEGVGRTDGDDDPNFCDCTSTPCECVRIDALRENNMTRSELIREIRSHKAHANFDARGKSDEYVRGYASVLRGRPEPDEEDGEDEESPPSSRPPRRGASSVHTDAVDDPEGHARRQMTLRNIQAGRRPLPEDGRASSTPVVVRTDTIRDDRADFDAGIDIEARAKIESRARAIRQSRGQGGGEAA